MLRVDSVMFFKAVLEWSCCVLYN